LALDLPVLVEFVHAVEDRLPGVFLFLGRHAASTTGVGSQESGVREDHELSSSVFLTAGSLLPTPEKLGHRLGVLPRRGAGAIQGSRERPARTDSRHPDA